MNRKQRRTEQKINKGHDLGQTQIGMQNLAQAIKILEDKFNQLHGQVNKQFNTLLADVGNAYDLLEAFGQVRKLEQPTLQKFNEYCKDKKFEEPIEYIKEYINFINDTFSTPDSVLSKFVEMSFDKRNRLKTLSQDEVPVLGDIAFISWALENNGQVIYAQPGMSFYQLGSNYLLDDNLLLQMKVNEQKEFDVNYPKDHQLPQLRGKSGQLKILIQSFKRSLIPKPIDQNLTEKDKKNIWKEKYQAQSIE